MFTCWQCSQYTVPGIVATSSTVVSRELSHSIDESPHRTPFCVYCSQLSIRRPATKETRPEAKSSLAVALLERSHEVETGTSTRYWGRRPVASIAHGVIGWNERGTRLPVPYPIPTRVETRVQVKPPKPAEYRSQYRTRSTLQLYLLIILNPS